MKKLILFGVITTLLVLSVGTVMAQPGPWRRLDVNPANIEEIPYGAETLLKLNTGKNNGFQLWITGDREWHCRYVLVGHNDGNGWSLSSWMPGYMYKCEAYE